MAGYLILYGLAWLVLAVVTGSVASFKGISGCGGALLALLLGPIALAIVLLMPSRT